MFARGPARGQIGCKETHLGWPKGDPSSYEFVDECLRTIKDELMEAVQVRGGAINIPLEKFGSEINLIRFLMRVCVSDWFRENGLMIFCFGKKSKADKFAIGLRRQSDFWNTRKARGAYKASRIETYGVPEYGEELMKGIYGIEESVDS